MLRLVGDTLRQGARFRAFPRLRTLELCARLDGSERAARELAAMLPGGAPAAVRAAEPATVLRVVARELGPRLEQLDLCSQWHPMDVMHGPELAEELRQHVAGELRTGWSESWVKL